MSNKFERHVISVEMPDGSIVKIPYFMKGEGEPVLYIQAAQHGVELTGVYTIKLLMERINKQDISGTLILVPIANPLAVKWRRHFYKMELGEPYSSDHPHQMNRLWPGRQDGNETERIVYALYNNLVSKADYVIDLHCWEMWRCGAALGLDWDKVSVDMCKYSLLKFISLRSKATFKGKLKGMISYVATEAGAHAITIEHSGQRWVFTNEAEKVCNGLMNIMRYIGLLEGEIIEPQIQFLLGRDPHVDIYAPQGDWILILSKSHGDKVSKGDLIAKVMSMETLEEKIIQSPIKGIVYEIGATRPHVDTRPSEEVLVISKGERYRIATIYELP